MGNLILRPSGLPEKHNKPWSLQLRYHESSGPTIYHTLVRVSDETAQEIIDAGAAKWLFGEPGWEDRARRRDLEKARILEEQASKIREGSSS